MGISDKLLAKHPFVFTDGGAAYTMEDFIQKLRIVSDSEFIHHVANGRNDYSTWFLHSFNDSFLARMIKHITNRRELVEFLEEYVDLHKSPEQYHLETSGSQHPNFESPNSYADLAQRSETLLKNQERIVSQQEQQSPFMKQGNISGQQPITQVAPPSQQPAAQPVETQYNNQTQPLPTTPEHHMPVAQPPVHHNVTSPAPPSPHPPVPKGHEEFAGSHGHSVHEKPVMTQSHPEPVKEHSEYQPHVEKDSFVQEHKEALTHPHQQSYPHPQGQEFQPRPSSVSLENEKLSAEIVAEYSSIFKRMREEIAKVFIGQDHVVHMVLIALVCEAHVLLEGVPGLAKSVLVEVLAKTIQGTKYSRIQFLPDLLPSDVVGGQIYNPKTNEFKTIKGPIFANFVLADEVNRAPPKTHAALMEAMAERKINIDKEEFILDRPFLVMATQNPLENKGTYALPEAVLDRFMFKVDLEYPKREHELIIIERNNNTNPELRKSVEFAATKDKIMEMQKNVKKVHLSSKIKNYILDIIEATRGDNKNIEGIKFVKYGAGPRASIALGIAAKAQSLMEGRNYVLPEDVQTVAKSILRHRVSLNFKGKAYNISSDKIVEEILSKVKIV